jgi:hypothetical protein
MVVCQLHLYQFIPALTFGAKCKDLKPMFKVLSDSLDSFDKTGSYYQEELRLANSKKQVFAFGENLLIMDYVRKKFSSF